ncbi:MAG TPA: hypothetical protein ENN51_01920, partial [candidate division WOR-3 bacterium]|nr:hypothetical protein [candidate division WOR-3 bacterium]
MSVVAALSLCAALTVLPGLAGDRLYEQGLFEAAVTEYLRELYAGTGDPVRLRLKLAFGYAAAGETESAADEFRYLALNDTGAGP